MEADAAKPSRAATLAPAALALAVGAAVYAVGRNVTPDYGTSLFGQVGPDTLPLKSWLASGVLALATFQLVSALWMYGRLPGLGDGPARLPLAHRAGATALVALTVPIAYHCLLAYGVQTFDLRVAVHSIAGSLLYGAVAAKVLVVRSRRLPGWALPVAGGTVVAVVAVLWYTSALWYFDGYSLPVL